MHLKRAIQLYIRKTKELCSPESSQWVHNRILEMKKPVPPQFSRALFNFTIDFELFWGNGNLGGHAHTERRRILAAEKQAENFYPFVKMLNEIGFPISWALLGCLVNCKAPMNESEKFAPTWERNDWYSLPESLVDRDGLWNGKPYLDFVKASEIHEVLSHGFAHIDYGDPSTSRAVAYRDMKLSFELLREFGFDVSGFVFPCNRKGHESILSTDFCNIMRGTDSDWHVQGSFISTPVGFWLSPGICSLKEMKSIIMAGIENRSFIHPWMHLIECELRCNDIKDFYRPLFEFVLELQAKSRIKNISFAQIGDCLSSPALY